MSEYKIDPIRPGQPMYASTGEALRLAAERRRTAFNGGSLYAKTGSFGTAAGANGGRLEGLWIVLTGSSGARYAWTEQIPDSSGTWVDGGQSGTTSDNYALEVNGVTGLPNSTKVWAYTDPDGSPRFQLSKC